MKTIPSVTLFPVMLQHTDSVLYEALLPGLSVQANWGAHCTTLKRSFPQDRMQVDVTYRPHPMSVLTWEVQYSGDNPRVRQILEPFAGGMGSWDSYGIAWYVPNNVVQEAYALLLHLRVQV